MTTQIVQCAVFISFILLTACGSTAKRPVSSNTNSVTAQKIESPEDSSAETSGFHDPHAASQGAKYTVVTAYHVIFLESSGLQLRTDWLQGRLYPTRAGTVPSLDDPASFKVEVEAGKTEISLPDLSRTLKATVLKNSKLKNVRILARGRQEIEIDARLQKVVPLPVQLLGEIAATRDGRLAIRIQSLKVLHIPFKGLLRAVHLSPSELVDVHDSKAIQIQGESIYLNTDQLLPPPRKFGNLTSVHFTEAGDLEEDYGSPTALGDLARRGKAQNFMQLEGGAVRFGKLTMQNTDMTLIDSSPGDWFQFDLEHYRSQLVAGDLHMTMSGGLLVFTPDYDKIEGSGKLPSKRPDLH